MSLLAIVLCAVILIGPGSAVLLFHYLFPEKNEEPKPLIKTPDPFDLDDALLASMESMERQKQELRESVLTGKSFILATNYIARRLSMGGDEDILISAIDVGLWNTFSYKVFTEEFGKALTVKGIKFEMMQEHLKIVRKSLLDHQKKKQKAV